MLQAFTQSQDQTLTCCENKYINIYFSFKTLINLGRVGFEPTNQKKGIDLQSTAINQTQPSSHNKKTCA
jgi:hypothetical protein